MLAPVCPGHAADPAGAEAKTAEAGKLQTQELQALEHNQEEQQQKQAEAATENCSPGEAARLYRCCLHFEAVLCLKQNDSPKGFVWLSCTLLSWMQWACCPSTDLSYGQPKIHTRDVLHTST